MKRRDIEDVSRALARRWVLIAVVTVACTLASVAYARIGASGGQRAEVAISIDSPVAFVTDRPEMLDAGREAARLSDELDALLGDGATNVVVRGDGGRRAVVISALGDDGATAAALAMDVAERYVAARQAEFRDGLKTEADFRQLRVDSLGEQIAALDDALDSAAADQSSALRDQRIQLVQAELDEQSKLDGVNISIERGDVGLAEPVLQKTVASTGLVSVLLFATVGAILGLLLGSALALGLDAVDHRLYTSRDIAGVAPTVPIIAVLGRDPDRLESSEVAVLQRNIGDHHLVAVAPTHSKSGSVRGLERLGGDVVEDAMAVPDGARVVVAVLQGTTSDSELVHLLTSLDMVGQPASGIVLYDVPRRELDWARRR